MARSPRLMRRRRYRCEPLGYNPLMNAPKPLILLDVDGVLNPAPSSAEGYRRHWVFPHGIAHRLSLSPRHGPMLLELAEVTSAELVWASYWRELANRWIAPRVGLPSLRFIPIPTRFRLRGRMAPGIWKACHAAAWVGRTPFVWFEDDLNVGPWLRMAPEIGRHLTVRVDPAEGLTRHHLREARSWLTALRQ